MDFTGVYCEICGFQLNLQYSKYYLFMLLSVLFAPGVQYTLSDSGREEIVSNIQSISVLFVNFLSEILSILLRNPHKSSDFSNTFADFSKSLDFT